MSMETVIQLEDPSLANAAPRIVADNPSLATEPLLVGREEAAVLTGISRASWDRLSSAGKNPMPLKLGGRVLWRRSDLDRWIALGLPDRKTFLELTKKMT